MLYILADNYSKQDGWSWQGILFGLGLLVVAAIAWKVIFRRR